ncbi:MAG: protein-L-isoaspartate O-methyltransferase, partial [Planctomycetota bacterium]
RPTDRVLEIGTGSGYQAAVLSPLVSEVYSIEIVGSLGRRAARTLKRLRYKNVFTKVGDGYLGWPEHAPFDKIIVTCSPESPPKPLVEQLREGGLMIIPVGERYQQNLVLMRKVDGQLQQQRLQATLFVPMTGAAEERRRVQPDAANPQVRNGGFERVFKDGNAELPEGWHYLRRARVVADETTAPAGSRYLQFENDEPGLGCLALQGFAIDGREVSSLRVNFSARGKGIRYGQTVRQWPYVVVTFYDDRRGTVGEQVIGPFLGDFDWTAYDKTLSVPLKTREAILRIGLLGAIGEIAFDDFRLSNAETP